MVMTFQTALSQALDFSRNGFSMRAQKLGTGMWKRVPLIDFPTEDEKTVYRRESESHSKATLPVSSAFL
jgi:hypothetical protein